MRYSIITGFLALGLTGCNLNGVTFDTSNLPDIICNECIVKTAETEKSLQEELDLAQARIVQLQSLYESLEADKLNIQDELDAANAEINRLRGSVTSKNADITRLNSKISNLEMRLEPFAYYVFNEGASNEKHHYFTINETNGDVNVYMAGYGRNENVIGVESEIRRHSDSNTRVATTSGKLQIDFRSREDGNGVYIQSKGDYSRFDGGWSKLAYNSGEPTGNFNYSGHVVFRKKDGTVDPGTTHATVNFNNRMIDIEFRDVEVDIGTFEKLHMIQIGKDNLGSTYVDFIGIGSNGNHAIRGRFVGENAEGIEGYTWPVDAYGVDETQTHGVFVAEKLPSGTLTYTGNQNYSIGGDYGTSVMQMVLNADDSKVTFNLASGTSSGLRTYFPTSSEANSGRDTRSDIDMGTGQISGGELRFAHYYQPPLVREYDQLEIQSSSFATGYGYGRINGTYSGNGVNGNFQVDQ